MFLSPFQGPDAGPERLSADPQEQQLSRCLIEGLEQPVFPSLVHPRVGGGEGALAGDGVDVPLRLQSLVGPLDGVGVDGQGPRHGAD